MRFSFGRLFGRRFSRRRRARRGSKRRSRGRSRRRSRRGRRGSRKGKSSWIKALQKHGYMKAGASFKLAPKKGTAAYKAVKRTHEAMKG